jgi:hypothetical protein
MATDLQYTRAVTKESVPPQKPGTVLVNKGEPSATETAQLTRSLTDAQKQRFQQQMAHRLRTRAFGPPPAEVA